MSLRLSILLLLLVPACGKVNATCSPGFTTCSGKCADLQTDASNCGMCGNACAMGATCTMGTCGGGCTGVDLQTDPNNCGKCGNVCPDGACAAGACACAGTLTACGGSCVDTSTDSNNCNTCGNACTGGKTCQSSTCTCPTGQTDCSGTCANLMTDAAHCGGCGTACSVDRVCSGGNCVCPAGKMDCGGTCIDPNTDSNHCGGCSTVCTGGKGCTGATCSCPSGQNDCSGTCVNFQTDSSHCGDCTTVCMNGTSCVGASCSCPASAQACGAFCCQAPVILTRWVDPTGSTDSANLPLKATFQPTGVPGSIYECRTGPASTFTPSVPAWANCDGTTGANATLTVTGLPTGLDQGGSYRTEYRYRVPSQTYTSPAVGFDWYLHNSLKALPGCNAPFTDDQYFAAAKAVAGFDTASAFPNDGSVKLRDPFIEIPLVNATTSTGARFSGFLYDGSANKITQPLPANLTWKTLTLRHRLVMSTDRTMILSRRIYQSRHMSCGDDQWFGSDAGFHVGPVDAMRPTRHSFMHCDAVVINRAGVGVCLFGPNPNPGTSVPQVRAVDHRLPAAATAGPGTVTISGTSVTVSGANFQTLVPKYIQLAGDRYYYKVASINSATTLTLQENAGAFVGSQTWTYNNGTLVPVILLPNGYTHLPRDHQYLRKHLGGAGKTNTKCTGAATCNDAYPNDIFYLPP